MRFSVFIILAVATCAFAQNSTASDGTATLNSTIPHIDPATDDHGHTVPILTKPCDCPTPNCPPFLNAKALCECLNNAEVACYKKSNGGCDEPQPKEC